MEPRIISISTETIVKTVVIVVSIFMAWLIRDILLLLFSAVLLAGILYPFAQWAARHKIPRGLAVGLLYLALFVLLTAVISFLIPALIDQARLASTNLGGTFGWLRDGANQLRDLTDRVGLGGGDTPTFATVATRLQETAINLVTSLNGVLGTVGAVVVVLVLSFYLIIEDTAVKHAFNQIVPERYRDFVSVVTWQVVEKLGAWARGQFTVSGLVGIATFLIYTVLGVPYALLLALVAGISEFVPYLGPVTAASAAIFVALTVSPWKALAVLIFIGIYQQIQANVITPKVMQRAVGLHPVVSIAAFLIGAKLFGVVGAIFSIPVATAVSVALNEYGKFRNRDQNLQNI